MRTRHESYGLRAFGVRRLTVEEITRLRRQPGCVRGKPLPATFLRNADAQSVAALAATLQAIADHRLEDESFADWGVLAGPRFLGRVATCHAMEKFRENTRGTWALVIPFQSIHAVPGTVSMALGIHGLNLGVGAGPNNLQDALMTAYATLAEGRLPGLWVVLCEWAPEPTPATESECICTAVALAFQAVSAQQPGPRLVLRRESLAGGAPCPLLESLARYLDHPTDTLWTCPLPWGAAVHLTGNRCEAFGWGTPRAKAG